jgi:hypothetical protein
MYIYASYNLLFRFFLPLLQRNEKEEQERIKIKKSIAFSSKLTPTEIHTLVVKKLSLSIENMQNSVISRKHKF